VLRANSEGFPEKIVSWQPQSSITLLMPVGMKLGRLTTMLPDDKTRGFLGAKASAKRKNDDTNPEVAKNVIDLVENIMILAHY
jgi:hypothetical protein